MGMQTGYHRIRFLFPITRSGKMGDINLYVSSKEYGYVELAHSVLAHFISDQVSQSP